MAIKHTKAVMNTALCITGTISIISITCAIMGIGMDKQTFIALFLILVLAMLAAGIALASEDAGDEIRERTLWIKPSDLVRDKAGNRCVRIWCLKAVFLPVIPVKVVHVAFPAPQIYDIVRMEGKEVKFLARYVRKQRFLTVTDNYLDILEMDSRYPDINKSERGTNP